MARPAKKKTGPPAPTYASKSSSQKPTKAIVIEQALDEIYRLHGTVTQKLIVDAARSPSHPLHSEFEWNDSVAGERYRENQALQMIMATKFVVFLNQPSAPPPLIDGSPVRKFLPRITEPGFKLRNEVLSEPEVRAALIERKKNVLRSWCRETIDIEELRPIRDALAPLLG